MCGNIPDASAAFFSTVATGTPVEELDQALVAEIEELREDIRIEEGGGGMCHFVTEVLSARYGWGRLFVTYLSDGGDVICGGGHMVNILPDGSVLDSTRDQFGEGHSVSLIRSDDPEIGRYRPEFYEDFHPGHPDDRSGQLDPWWPSYAGVIDCDEQSKIAAIKGERWWLSDKTASDAYEARQEELRLGRQPTVGSSLAT